MARRTPRASTGPPTDNAPGGFILPAPAPSGLLSPPPSSLASSSLAGPTLPTPRHHPLKAGSPKEAAFINYVDKGIQDVQRKFALRDVPGVLIDEGEERERFVEKVEKGEKGGKGYTAFVEAARDLERLVDVVWVSGTLSLQIPQLLQLAALLLTYIPAFPPQPRALFHLLDKVDTAFASLILGQDVQTGEPLPMPAESGRRGKVNGTEKVRIKSLVERTRVCVVEFFSDTGVFDLDGEDELGEGAHGRGDGMDTETETEGERMDVDVDVEEEEHPGWDMEMARVYARTLNELGDELVGPHIGI